MTTKYDIFLAVASHGSIEEGALKSLLGVTDERQFNQDLQYLSNDKYIEKQQTKYVYLKNQNSETLFDVLSFALTYNINYNNYFTSTMQIFLEQTYLQKYFGLPEVQQVEEMKRINISILRKNGFMIILNPRPFLGKIIQNSFLDVVLKLGRRTPAPMDKKKKDINIENFLVEKLMKKHIQAKMKITTDPTSQPEIKYYEHDDPSANVVLSLSREQMALKNRISSISKETLNVEFMENLKKAENRMTQNVKNRVRISKDVIVDYHRILMNDPSIGGIIRKENVQVAGNPYFKTSHFKSIESLLDKFIARYQKSTFKNMPEIVKFGAYMHNELQFIHPFIDGNSRLTRLVMDHFFRENNAPIYEIPVAYISRYSAITKGSKKRDDNKLFELFKEIFLYILCKE
jgi:fido (protein-threonine AMPylation protein)